MNNAERSTYALSSVNTFAIATGIQDEDMETQISDLLADLMHLADEHDIDWAYLDQRAGDHYRAEVEEEAEEELGLNETKWIMIDGFKQYFTVELDGDNYVAVVPEFASESWQRSFSLAEDAKAHADKAYDAIRNWYLFEHTELQEDASGNYRLSQPFLDFETGALRDDIWAWFTETYDCSVHHDLKDIAPTFTSIVFCDL